MISKDDLLKSFPEVSNWGRWGDDDELGTLNLITPEKTASAVGMVRSGRVVSISHDLSTKLSPRNVDPIRHRMLYRNNAKSAVDEVLMYNHGLAQTHLDAVAHFAFDGFVYNGKRAEDVILTDGLSFGSIHAMRDGIVTRGVLLDVAGARGVEWLEPPDMVTASDLDAALERSGVEVGEGDALFIRIGLDVREQKAGPEDPTYRVGLEADCPRWLHERGVALVGSDCPERRPAYYPELGAHWHIAALVYMGLAVLDTPDMGTLARVCREESTNEFLFMAAPLRIPRATGCAVNALCVF